MDNNNEKEPENVVSFPGAFRGNIDPDKVISVAEEEQTQGRLKTVVIVGETPDGKHYYSSSSGDPKEIVYLLECFKNFIMTYTGPEIDDE